MMYNGGENQNISTIIVYADNLKNLYNKYYNKILFIIYNVIL